MSQLFDALHRSESQRRTGDQNAIASGPELLEIAERQHQKRTSQGLASAEDQEATLVRETLGPIECVPAAVSPQETLVCVTDEKSLAAEKFRFLSLRLSHVQQRRTLKTLLITSSTAEEGKSMIAANLACALANRRRQKVLLVEGDLRRPVLASLLGTQKNPGLGGYLQNEPGATACMYELKNLGLWFLPAGDPPKNPLGVMESERLSQLMNQFQSQFDWIVIDSPPVLPLGDTSVWMRLADGILLVTRPGKTTKRQLERGLEAIEQPKLIGAIINGSQDVHHSDYYYYYGTSKGRSQASANEAVSRP
jgi:capsular exopolysaccharide synthesis family protein